MRIVSLLPSATEILCGLGLKEFIVGVTHECDFPPSIRSLPKVTHTKIPTDASSKEIDELVRDQLHSKRALYTLNMEALKQIQPDLIVTQALCDVCAVAESEVRNAACELGSAPKVINLEPSSLAEVLESIREVGHATGRQVDAEKWIEQLHHRIEIVRVGAQSVTNPPRVLLLEWIDPPFCSGHWNPELVELAGGREVLGKAGHNSVQVTWDDIVAADPDIILVACCGFDVQRAMQDLPILEAQPHWFSLKAVRNERVHWVDGSAYFSRPGPRLVDSLEILARLIQG